MRWLRDPFSVFGLVVALLMVGALTAGIMWGQVSWAAIFGQVLGTFALLGLIAMYVFGVRPRLRRRRSKHNDRGDEQE